MLLTRYNTFLNPDVAELERVLTEVRDRLSRAVKDRGGDV